MNPRFVAYASANGRTPEAQLAHDAEAFPGGKMCGFIIWIGRQWRAWALATKHPRAKDSCAILTEADHAAFTAWVMP